MFMKEIADKVLVELYDNELQPICKGIITGFIDATETIVINHKLYFPASQVAKIVTFPQDEFPCGQASAHRHS